jgi:hypothetical protein
VLLSHGVLSTPTPQLEEKLLLFHGSTPRAVDLFL